MKIGITMRIDEFNSISENRVSLDINWICFFETFGYRYQLIPYSKIIRPDYLDNIDIVIFSGGNDLSEYNNNFVNRIRDESEFQLLDLCIKSKKKVVGICRGMQLINFYFSGRQKKIDGHLKQNHLIKSEAKWLTDIKLVNSFHNWGIPYDYLSDSLNAMAFSKDENYVEALEHKSLLIRGVMWHPERNTFDKLSNEDYFRSQQKILEF